jgi:hypothetical protein
MRYHQHDGDGNRKGSALTGAGSAGEAART